MRSSTEESDLTSAAAALLGGADQLPDIRVEPIKGGRNNRVFRVHGTDAPAVLKKYFSNPRDPRDRFAAERRFYEFVTACGSPQVPMAFGWDSSKRLGAFAFIEGAKLDASEIDAAAVDSALRFFATINGCHGLPSAQRLGPASEACFSVESHLALVGARVERTGGIDAVSDTDARALSFVRDRLSPVWPSVRDQARRGCERAGISPSRELAPRERCVSPSDFGFHNAIRRGDGTLVFFDFEYAGWDDPAKTASDFFCQQQKPVPMQYHDTVVERIGASLGEASELPARAALLLPVYQVKWCCIILNDFLTADSARRTYAARAAVSDEKKAQQLAAAERLLAEVEAQLS